MSRFRITLAAMTAALILTSVAGAAHAARPLPESTPSDPPLSDAEVTASERRMADAERYVAIAEDGAAGRATLSCLTPESEAVALTPGGSTASSEASLGDVTIMAGCGAPMDFLDVSPRDQTRSYYCGPAVGQVIANQAWAVAANANKYGQGKIAGWMQTDVYGGTSAGFMEVGLERATLGAPLRPANWDWVVSVLSDTDRDGTVGDQLYAYVRSNVSGSNMALALSVKPHDANGRFHLSSWPRPVNSVGHWIAAFGWYGVYDGTDYARLYYTDSSKDEGGSTGEFWDPMRHIGGMIMDHTQHFVW